MMLKNLDMYEIFVMLGCVDWNADRHFDSDYNADDHN